MSLQIGEIFRNKQKGKNNNLKKKLKYFHLPNNGLTEKNILRQIICEGSINTKYYYEMTNLFLLNNPQMMVPTSITIPKIAAKPTVSLIPARSFLLMKMPRNAQQSTSK